MATDDQPEKSLFARIKDCVLTELRRKRNEAPRAPCPSRSFKWVWTLDRESTDGGTRRAERGKEDDESTAERAGVGGLRTGRGSSDKHGTSRVEENCTKLDSADSESYSSAVGQVNEKERVSAEENNSGAEPNLTKPDRFEPRRYNIKMQDPEAPPCCEFLIPRKICPPKTKKPKTSDEDCEQHRKRPFCRCGGCSFDAN